MNVPIIKTDEGSHTALAKFDGVDSLIVGYDSDCCCSAIKLNDIIFMLEQYGYKVIKEKDIPFPTSDEVDTYLRNYYKRK